MAEIVLVTGGTGFVGGWCVVELLKRGYSVRATVRQGSREAPLRSMVAAAGVSQERLSIAVADLRHDEGWDAAMVGCGAVLHVASSLGGAGESADALVSTAQEGTLRVLRAAVRAQVRRVVFTSSCAAATPTRTTADSVSDEETWTEDAAVAHEPYRRSKLFAERAAWELMRTSGGATELVTILPSAVFGPVLTTEGLGSVQVIQRLLTGKMPVVPRVGLCIVDVRELAALHVRALEVPSAAGQRFIASGEFLWLGDGAATLRSRLGARAAKVSTRRMPDFVVRLLAPFVPALRTLRPLLNRRHRFSSEKARRELGYEPRPVAETIVDCADSLLAG